MELVQRKIKVLVVDDSSTFRKIIADILSTLPGLEVVGTANNGRVAISKIPLFKPDLLSLDVEMPEMDGLELLAYIKDAFPEVSAVVVSGVGEAQRDAAMKALSLGAFDFVPKPALCAPDKYRQAVREAFIPVLKAFSHKLEISKLLKGIPAKPVPSASESPPAPDSSSMITRMRALAGSKNRPEIIGIAISTGGPRALDVVLPKIPADLGVPILIVQHMPAAFTESLAKSLNNKCSLFVKEARDGEIIQPNTVYIAPGGKQMKAVVSADGKSKLIKITDDPPENSCKPSADYLFKSMAPIYGDRITGVIMTGMGCDGVSGLTLLRKNGCTVIAQDQTTSTVFGMPREAINAGIVDVVAPLDQIAAEICRTISDRKFQPAGISVQS